MSKLIGERFGRLVVTAAVIRRDRHRNRYVPVRCDCGTQKLIRLNHLRAGKIISCGCAGLIYGTQRHGFTNHILYSTWLKMMQRCYHSADKRYKDYGGRGIVVCDRWHAIENFISDMMPKIIGCTLDRIDNNQSYSPENCRWATPKEQQNNGRFNLFLTWDGQTHTIHEWADLLGIQAATLYSRYKRKWDIKRMMTQTVSKSIQLREPRKEKP